MARDSLLLTASYGLSAVVGVAFWALAARLVPPEQLGIGTATLSVFTAAGQVAATGVANALLTMIPVAGAARPALLRLGYGVVAVVALLFGAAGGALAATVLPGGTVSVASVGGLALAATVWSWFVLQDAVLTALGKASWLLAENVPGNIVKVALLPPCVAILGSTGRPVVVATVVPALLAVAVVSGVVVPLLVRRHHDPSEGAAAERAAWLAHHRAAFALFAVRDGAAGALTLGLFMGLPFVVTAVAGPVQGAVFALCLQVSYAMDMFTAGVSVSLTTNVAPDAHDGALAYAAARRMWWRLLRFVGAAAVLVVAGAPLLLWLFGRTYLAHGGWAVVAVLAVGSLMRTTFEVWTALLRALRRTGVLLAWTVVGSVAVLGAVIGLAHSFGAIGAACGVTAGTAITSAVGAVALRRGRTVATGVTAAAVTDTAH